MNNECVCQKCQNPADATQGFGDLCEACLMAEVGADLAEIDEAGKYPSFACPICRGQATLVDGPHGEPEFCCLDCPLPYELVESDYDPFEDYSDVA